MSTIPRCPHCTKIQVKTALGYKCLTCRVCPHCQTDYITNHGKLVCPTCGLVSESLVHSFDHNINFKDMIHMDRSIPVNHRTGTLAGSYETRKLLKGAPEKLIRTAVGETEWDAAKYISAVTENMGKIADFEYVEESIIKKIYNMALDYINVIITESTKRSLIIPKVYNIVATVAILYALRSQTAVIGIHDIAVINNCATDSGLEKQKFVNRVLAYKSDLELSSVIPEKNLIDAVLHRRNVFSRWCAKMDIMGKDFSVVETLLDQCVKNVWLGGRQFEYCMACVLRHLYIDGCSKCKMNSTKTVDDLKHDIEEILFVQWKTLPKGCAILAQRHDTTS